MISVQSPARLHVALLNESGLLGRIDGGIGVAVDSPAWQINLEMKDEGSKCAARKDQLEPELMNAARLVLDKYQCTFALPDMHFSIQQRIPLHAGLGAKTSLMMALGRGIDQLLGNEWSNERIADFVGRGGTSGIGVHASTSKGLIWDVGRRYPDEKQDFLPSSFAKNRSPRKAISLPLNWTKIAHFRFADRGLHGAAEMDFFRKNCPVASQETTRILAIVAGQLIPSLVDRDIDAFQNALIDLQDLGLKKAEWEAQASITKRFRVHFRSRLPDIALGLSSAGPTLFCIHDDIAAVRNAVYSFETPPLHFEESEVFFCS